jgi:hypothetical protein
MDAFDGLIDIHGGIAAVITARIPASTVAIDAHNNHNNINQNAGAGTRRLSIVTPASTDIRSTYSSTSHARRPQPGHFSSFHTPNQTHHPHTPLYTRNHPPHLGYYWPGYHDPIHQPVHPQRQQLQQLHEHHRFHHEQLEQTKNRQKSTPIKVNKPTKQQRLAQITKDGIQHLKRSRTAAPNTTSTFPMLGSAVATDVATSIVNIPLSLTIKTNSRQSGLYEKIDQ